jgi:hypothetical protein
MSYTDELIKQALERYNASDIPVNDEEIKFFIENVPEATNEIFKDMLVYVHGRSWYWSRLMGSVGLPETMKPENVDIEYLMQQPAFVVGLHVAMFKLCGFKIEVKELVVETIPEAVKVSKPKPKHKK